MFTILRKMRKLIIPFLFTWVFLPTLFAQNTNAIQRIEPPNWWVGMKEPSVQLLFHGSDINHLEPGIEYDGISIERVIKVENDNYLFVDLKIAPETKPGMVSIQFKHENKVMETHDWELEDREPGSAAREGFNNTDVLYLITPDRFANGDPSNDNIAGMREEKNRSNEGGRHGGDIEGIRQHLDYIKDLGFTAIWLNPVLENDMEKYSYHGYSTTDFYKVDPRFGSNESYRQLSKEAQAKGITLIMDMIVNHCGSFHWWMDDMPSDDWINTWPAYTGTNHQKSVIQDPYASEIDTRLFTDGWFVPTMPDLNQRNPLMATYLIQNAIWWIEYLGLSGIRMDTYPYPDMHFMTEWTRRVEEEYPNFNVVGEEWQERPSIVAYWQKGKNNPNGYKSYLRSLMDFPVRTAMQNSLLSEGGWRDGWMELYEMLGQDFLYADPNELVVFPDNHDMSRIFTQVNEDFDLYKMGLAFVCTTRGVPQIYYGTEILMKHPGSDSHGMIRSDFPGGWPGDEINARTGAGLTDQEKEAQTFVKRLLTWRQTADAIHYGKLMHFRPEGDKYVYFRYNDDQKFMIILNKSETETELKLDRFAEMLDGVSTGKDVLNDTSYDMKKSITLPKRSVSILELK